MAGFCLWGSVIPSFAETTDPVGYNTMKLPAESTGLLAVNLVKSYTFRSAVTAVDGAKLSFDKSVPSTLFGSYDNGSYSVAAGGFAEVREGTNAGITFKIESFTGNSITLHQDPGDLIDVGDLITVRPEWTLGDIVERLFAGGLLSGSTAEEADILGTWDAETQTARAFFLHTNGSLLEVGKEEEGEKSSTLAPFPSAFHFTRRGATDIDVVLVGAVPVPYDQFRYLPVWPGRNLLSGPFTDSTSVSGWELFESGSPFSVIAGPSAPESDTLRFTYPDGTESPILYYRQDVGWRLVGESGSGADTPIDFTQGIDYRRIGPAGFIRFAGVRAAAEARVATSDNHEVIPTNSHQYVKTGIQLDWSSAAGETYQVQTKSLGSQVWRNLGTSVTSTTTTCHSICSPKGAGEFRIIKLP